MHAARFVGVLNLVSDVKALVPGCACDIMPVLLNQLLIDQSCYTFHPIGDYSIPQV
jgi:hypothetical protein